MIVLSGASASGKTEVAKMLASKYGITKVITTTTRPMRVGEVNGRDYFFVSKDEFEQMIRNDEFVEFTIYNGNYYGSTKAQIGENKVIVIDPQGLKAYSQLGCQGIVTFFLNAEEATRLYRMLLRGDKESDAVKRIQNDKHVFNPTKLAKVDYKINSETQTVEEVTDEIYALYKAKIEKNK